MIDIKKRNEAFFAEFELEEKKLPKDFEVSDCGRVSDKNKMIMSRLVLKFEARNEKEAAKFTSLKHFRSLQRDDLDKYVWYLEFSRHY